MSYRIVVPVEGSGGFINGVSVDAWEVSRFADANVPAKDSAPPSGSPDAGPVTTATNGAPGQAVLDVPAGFTYNVRVQQGGHSYWTQTSEALGVKTFQGRTAAAATMTKADVTGTGLTYSDVGADASGAATTAQSAAQTYADRYAGSAAGTASRPLAATDASVTNTRTPTAHASTHGSAGSDPVTIAKSQVTGLGSSASTTSAVLNALDYGVVGDAYLGAGGSIASSTWTDSAGPFVAGSVGKAFWVEQLDGVWFRTTIASYISATQVTLTATPASVDNQGVYLFGTDNSTAVTSLWSSAVTLANAGAAQPVYFPAGGYLFNTGILSRTTMATSAIRSSVAACSRPRSTRSAWQARRVHA